MKNTVILMLLGALAGVFIASWVVPPALAWYTAPGGLPQGAQFKRSFRIPEVIRYATGKLIRWQWISAGIGAALGLVLGVVLGSKSRRPPDGARRSNQPAPNSGPIPMSRLRLALCIAAVPLLLSLSFDTDAARAFTVSAATVNQPSAVDRSRPLWMLADAQRPVVPVEAEEHDGQTPSQRSQGAPAEAPKNAAGAKVEQTKMGTKPAAVLADSFDGIGVGFEGPHGLTRVGNPSDNSLAVGPDHIVQTVNTRMAIFTKKGKKYDTTGKVLYGGVPNNTVFAGFTGICEATNNGDTVVRYDQLADRWLIVMPIFRRAAPRPDQPEIWKGGPTVWTAPPGVAGQPGKATPCSCPRPHLRSHPRRQAVPLRSRRRAVPALAQAPVVLRLLRASRRLRHNHRRRKARMRCATPSARRRIRWASTTAMSFSGPCFPTIRVRRSGPTATTCPPARATTSSRSTSAWPIETAC
jgi:hypothetical protein